MSGICWLIGLVYIQEVKAAEQTPDTARLYQQFLSRRNDINNEYGGQMPRNSGDLSKTLQDLTEKVVRVNKEEFSWGAICSFYSAELYGKRVALATPKPWRTYKIRMDAIAAGQVGTVLIRQPISYPESSGEHEISAWIEGAKRSKIWFVFICQPLDLY